MSRSQMMIEDRLVDYANGHHLSAIPGKAPEAVHAPVLATPGYITTTTLLLLTLCAQYTCTTVGGRSGLSSPSEELDGEQHLSAEQLAALHVR